MNHIFMLRAIRLASLGRYDAHPNPCVGAVIVKNGKIIGSGFHKRYGYAHAEVNAVEAASESVEGADIYVSLEPCSHQGKTPACADFLIKNKIKKVFVAMLDQNPIVSGRGVAKLLTAGIEVEVGLLEKEARCLNRAFDKAHSKGLPLVIGKIAMSIDGNIALDNGVSKWITNDLARLDAHKLRAMVSAIIVGKNTAIVDDPELTVRGDFRHRYWDRQPIKVLLDRRLEVGADSRIFQTGKTIVVHTSEIETTDTENIKYLREDSLEKVLRYLVENFEVNAVLIEGGGTIISEFLKNKLIDEMIVYQAPVILGSSKRAIKLELENLNQAIRLEHQSITKLGDNVKFVSKVKYL